MPKSSMVALAIVILIAFGLIWYRVSSLTPPWSDEPRHFLTAKSLAVLGQPVLWDFSKGYPLEIRYTRGMVINYPLAFLYKHGFVHLAWARTIPLFFVLLTIGFWIVYFRYKIALNATGVALAAIFLLGQPMVLEQATFVRIYAPLGLAFSIVLACLWELRFSWIMKQRMSSIGFAALCLLGVWIPIVDSWHVAHLLLLLPALVMLNSYVWKFCVRSIRKPVMLLLVFALLLRLGPVVIVALAKWIPRLAWGVGIHIDAGASYDTYWDNIFGLIRFFLAVNVMLIGLRWIHNDPDKRCVSRWLYFGGLASGVLLGLFAPPHYIFYSRYFYLSVIATTAGFAGMCVQENLKPRTQIFLIAGYLIASIAINYVNFNFDRSNSRMAMDWLKRNMESRDVLLSYSNFHDLYGVEELTGPNTYMLKDENVDRVIKFVSAPGVGHVYFLMENNYKFKNLLSEGITGLRHWSAMNRLVEYLHSDVYGRPVLNGLWGCDLEMFEPHQVVIALKNFKKRSHLPPTPLWQMNPFQKNIL